VRALREVAAAGAADRLVVAVRPDDVAQVVPLVEDALSAGPDLDVELVPVEDAATLLSEPWLAVGAPGATWHRSLADAVWTFDVPAPRAGGANGVLPRPRASETGWVPLLPGR
jgi:hypothetical protein